MSKSRMHRDTHYCYLCSNWGAGRMEWHHVLNGPFRKKAEEDGLKVKVHRTCHRFIHEHPDTANTLKKRAQRCYEEQIGTREEFMERYHRNYLEEE